MPEGDTEEHDRKGIPLNETERVVGYVRVSSSKQKAALRRQQLPVARYAEEHQWAIDTIYKDITSGLNDLWNGLNRLIRDGSIGYIDRVIIIYDDRLSRFGNHLLEWVLSTWGVTLERIQPDNLADGPEKQFLRTSWQ